MPTTPLWLQTLLCLQAPACSAPSHWSTQHALTNLLAITLLILLLHKKTLHIVSAPSEGRVARLPRSLLLTSALALSACISTGLLSLAVQASLLPSHWHPIPYRGASNFTFALFGLLCFQRLSSQLLTAALLLATLFTALALSSPQLSALLPTSLPHNISSSHLVHFSSWCLGIAFGALQRNPHRPSSVATKPA